MVYIGLWQKGPRLGSLNPNMALLSWLCIDIREVLIQQGSSARVYGPQHYWIHLYLYCLYEQHLTSVCQVLYRDGPQAVRCCLLAELGSIVLYRLQYLCLLRF